jgi:cyanophycinase
MLPIPSVFVSSFRVSVLFAVGACALAFVQSLSAQAAGRPGEIAAPSTTHNARPRELILAGGALKLCSSLATKDCTPDASATVAAVHARTAPRYGLAAEVAGEAFEVALDPRLWAGREAMRAPMRALLADARGKFAGMAVDEDTLRDHFESRCVGARSRVRPCRGTAPSPWLRLDDPQQSAVLAALELPQRDTHGRKREYAALDGGRLPHGAEILRTFVTAARAHAPGGSSSAHDATRRPRIAIVTASSFDPFDPVDMYLDALHQAGADVEWWPVDAALAAAVFDGAGCEALSALRLSILKLPGRERVYPDLAEQQARACAQSEALRTLPDRVQGVFFTGGDQWKLRRAFFRRDDTPNAWLLALRAAVARGDVVIAGTSAGSAVQSGAPMLSNGTPEWALKHGAIASPPPAPGCARSGDCFGGLDEDAFTFWPAGGLGLAPGIIIDTHFSERARELRLLRLLADTGTRLGIGIDETSALHLRWHGDDRLEITALGAHGGWVFDAAQDCGTSDYAATAYYLAPGPSLWLDAGVPAPLSRHSEIANNRRTDMLPPLLEPATTNPHVAPGTAPDGSPQDALARGALRSAARALNADREDSTGIALRAGNTDVCIALRPIASMVSRESSGDIRALRIEVMPWPTCAR